MQVTNLKNNPELSFARGTGVTVPQKNGTEKLSSIIAFFQIPKVLKYSKAEFDDKPRSEQDRIKSVNTVFPGELNRGNHGKKDVLNRSMLALDLDFATTDTLQAIKTYFEENGITYIIHSTLKSTPKKPRYRLYILLDCSIMETEYIAISRRAADDLGIEWFDPTTYDVNRLMFGPAVFNDTADEFVFEYQDGLPLCTNDYLSTYDDYRNTQEWPISSREKESINQGIKKQGDPLEKSGVVGSFCREYNIHEAIETFLPDKYEQCDENRYTFKGGSTAAGFIVYDDVFSFSHHGTDPTSGKLCNPYDLVRIHLFAHLDDKAKIDTPTNKLPSYLAMLDLATKDPKVRMRLINDRQQEANDDFAGDYQDETPEGDEPENDDWKAKIDIDRKGNPVSNNPNTVTIINNDQAFKGMAINTFSNRKSVTLPLPWRTTIGNKPDLSDWNDSDTDNAINYIEKNYGIASEAIIKRALRIVFNLHRYHPLRNYLNSIQWDGEGRADTIFIDYLGAEDTPYTRAVTRISLVAAVARIFEPGIPYDQVVILAGGQGIGKSTVLRKLGKFWFSDNFAIKGNNQDVEQLMGVWIMEIGELAGIRSREVADIKNYISRPHDEARLAYATEKQIFPRQCVFFGSTNESTFLTDTTGNRRFWPIKVEAKRRTKSPWEDLNEYQIDQIWAEAVQLYNEGEPLNLAEDLIKFANEEQEIHTQKDDRTGTIQEYLDKLLPENWSDLNIIERKRFIDGDALQAEGVYQRQKISIVEIWCECFGKEKAEMVKRNTSPLHAIMRSMEGWELSPSSAKGPERVKNYGSQTCYVRIKAEVKKMSMIKNKSLTSRMN